MKNFYIAVTVEENKKYYSYVIKVNNQENLLSKLKIKNIKIAAIGSTKKQAALMVNAWNAAHKANNQYLFDETF